MRKANGVTLAEFRKQFIDAARNKGWQVRGVGRSDKYMAWRAKLIFNTSMRSSVMAGRWVQIQKTKAAFAFLQYSAVLDNRTRKEHRAWHGIVRHVDDAFWHSHYPPNGYLCRCTVIQLSQRMVDQQGLRVATDPFKTPYRNVRDADGQVVDQVPVGIDAGWDSNVGVASSAPELALGEKLARLPQELRADVAASVVGKAFTQALQRRWEGFLGVYQQAKGTPLARPRSQVVGFLSRDMMSAIANHAPSLNLESTALVVPDSQVKHLRGSHKVGVSPDRVWPSDWVFELPSKILTFRALYFEPKTSNLLLIARDQFNNRLVKIYLRPNQKIDGKRCLKVSSLDTLERRNVEDGRFKLISGSLD